MTTIFRMCNAVVVAFVIAGVTVIAVCWRAGTIDRDRPYNELREQYRNTARHIRQQLTTDVLEDLRCDVNCARLAGLVSLSPTETEEARVLLTSILEYSDYSPVEGLDEIPLAPDCSLFYYRPQDAVENSLVSVEVYQTSPVTMTITTFGPDKHPPITAVMRYSEYGDFRELLGMLKCHRE